MRLGRTAARALLAGTTALTLAALPASAQVPINFSTAGQITGANPSICTVAGPPDVSCQFGDLFAGYTHADATGYLGLPGATTTVNLGDFFTTATGTGVGTIPAGSTATFTLFVFQTLPSSGTSQIFGSLSGTLAYQAGVGGGGGLIWTPSQDHLVINNVTYKLHLDGGGSFHIAAPGGTTTPATKISTLQADVTTTPEPASLLLLGSGLTGLLGFGKRRRRTQSEA